MKGVLNFDFLRQGSNSIGFLRLVLASMVVLSHSFALSGSPPFGHMYALVAVSGFFFLSGMLITQSFEHSASLWDYLWRRTLRIFPGYWGCLLVTAFVLVPIACNLQRTPFDISQALRFVIHGLPMIGKQDSVGDVFLRNPISQISNGSLWTLPLEYTSYLVIGLLGVVGALRYRWPVLAIAGLFVIWHIFPQARLPKLPHAPGSLSNANVLEPYLMFSFGAVAHLYRERLKIPTWMGPVSVCFLLFIFVYESPSPGFQLFSACLRIFAVPFALVWLACKLPFRNFGTPHDLSYGTYIYAYPIQQTLVVAGVLNGWALFALSYPLTLFAAFMSWTLIEARAMKYKRAFAKSKEVDGTVARIAHK